MVDSEKKFSLSRHFDGLSPVVRHIYDEILRAAGKFGDVGEGPRKTSINLTNKTAFAGIQTRRDYLILTIKSSEGLRSDRIFRREQTSANRWHLEIKLSSPTEVDVQLRGWLKRAYDLSGKEGK